jgi:hypothetical protein
MRMPFKTNAAALEGTLDSQTEIKLASQIDPNGTAGSGTYASGDYATYNYTGVVPSTASPSSTNAGGRHHL